jgi:hypothetical protein
MAQTSRHTGPMADKTQRINYGDFSKRGFLGFGRWQAILPEEPGQIYCTNEKGEGLFIQRLDNGAVRQIEGLGQFMPKDFDHFKRMIRDTVRPTA